MSAVSNELVRPNDPGGSASVRASHAHGIAHRAWRLFVLYALCGAAGAAALFVATAHGHVAPAIIGIVAIASVLALYTALRISAPLERIANAARRAADEVDAGLVTEPATSEFAEVAGAVASMTGRLRRETGIRAGLARIDTVILASVDMQHIASIALDLMGVYAGNGFRIVLLADASRANVFSVEAVDAAGTRISDRRRALDPAAVDALGVAFDGAVISPADCRRLGLDSLVPASGVAFQAQPILIANELAGVLLLACQSGERPHPAAHKMLRELADRLAVAVATSRRDDEIYRRAHYDHLTRLPNRQLLLQELARELARAERRDRPLALLLVDLDGFATLNDTLGHAAGDGLLLEVATRLKASVRKTDLVARLGADEFVIVLTDLVDPADAARVARGIIADMARPVDLNGADCFVSVSIGIAIAPGDANDAGSLLSSADMAILRAKSAGGGVAVFFEEAMNREAQERATLDRDLRRAITEGQFFLQYEPLVDADSGRVDGVEALIRWQHPTRGLVPPVQFIGFAEETGLIEPIGEWVLLTACRQFVEWRASGLALGTIAVNVSARQFQRADFAETVAATLALTGMRAGWLKLEVTESVLIDASGRVERTLARLNEIGVRLALDDFGTGYSSLAYLKRLPVETIKLDRSFVRDLSASEDARSIAQSAIAMVHALRKRIVAEGVETPEQLALLRDWGCDSLQGWYFTRSLGAEQFAAFVRARGGASTRHSAVRASASANA